MENETSFKLLFWSFTIILFMISGGVMWLFQYHYHRSIFRIEPEEPENIRIDKHKNTDITFSELEMQIISLTLQEYNGADIAEMLCISSKTLEYHKKKLMERTGSKKFMGVIKYAYDQKILT